MTKSLKEQNKPALYSLAVGNLVVFYALLQGIDLFSDEPFELLEQAKKLLPAGLGICLVGVLNSLVDAETKAKIVFLRFSNPLPGSRAFNSDMLAKDSRIDPQRLESKCGPAPDTARGQNSLWYRIYKKYCDDAAVIEAHKSFLFTRDYAVLCLLMAVCFLPLAFLQLPSATIALIYSVGMVAQFFLAMLAARNNGNRFALTVLATEAAS